MTTATHRVASLHLAKIQKEAQIKKKIADLLYEPVAKKLTTTAMAAHETIISKKSKAGWSWIGKSQNPSNIVKMLKSGGQPFNLNDPLQKLIHESIKSKKPLDQVDILGRFNLAFAKKDTSGMAEALSIEEELLVIVLLWYTREQGTSKRANNYSRRLMDTALQDAPMIYSRVIAAFPKKVLEIAEHITGGSVIEWLVKLVPGGHFVAKPIKWAWWTALVVKRWAVMAALTKWFGVAAGWLTSVLAGPGMLKALGTFVFIKLPSFLSIFVTIPQIWGVFGPLLFIYMCMDWKEKFWKYINKHMEWYHAVMTMSKAVWIMVKGVLKGLLAVPKFVIDEIKGYVKDLGFGKQGSLMSDLDALIDNRTYRHAY